MTAERSPLATLARRQPILTAEHERALITRAQAGDRRAVDAVILAHLRLVLKIARSFRSHHLATDDIAMAGVEGLLKAIKSFRPDRGRTLQHARRNMGESSHLQARPPIAQSVRPCDTARARSMFWRLPEAKRDLGIAGDLTKAQAAEIARRFGTSSDAVHQADAHRQGDRSLNVMIGLGDEGTVEQIALLVDDAPSQEDILIEADELTYRHSLLNAALHRLNERQRQVLIARRLTDPPVSLAELGQHYRVSRERIRQIEERAIERLKAEMSGAGGARVLTHSEWLSRCT